MAMSSESSLLLKIASFMALLLVTLVLMFVFGICSGYGLMEFSPVVSDTRSMDPAQQSTLLFAHRKLLVYATGKEGLKSKQKTEQNPVEPNRIWGDTCSTSDIAISQGSTPPLPSGIPTYSVEIINLCDSNISDIHLSCGWFSSARLINPKVFKRLRFNDCLVNNGKPLPKGRTISFQYANTFSYPLSVSSINY